MPDTISVSKWQNSMHKQINFAKTLVETSTNIKCKSKSELEKTPQAEGIPKLNTFKMKENKRQKHFKRIPIFKCIFHIFLYYI